MWSAWLALSPGVTWILRMDLVHVYRLEEGRCLKGPKQWQVISCPWLCAPGMSTGYYGRRISGGNCSEGGDVEVRPGLLEEALSWK